jgi:RimJ/RimL family protein N-acetyltransferase
MRMMFMIKKFPKETFILDCYSDNLPAVKLYTKCGFIVTKVVKHGKYNLLVMVRKPGK